MGQTIEKFLAAYKNFTHYAAVVLIAGSAFAASNAGQALVAQYPKLSVLFALVTTLSALYAKTQKGS